MIEAEVKILMNPIYDFNGQVALVTGAAKGMGAGNGADVRSERRLRRAGQIRPLSEGSRSAEQFDSSQKHIHQLPRAAQAVAVALCSASVTLAFLCAPANHVTTTTATMRHYTSLLHPTPSNHAAAEPCV